MDGKSSSVRFTVQLRAPSSSRNDCRVVVSGIDGLRRDRFPNDKTYERFEKLMTATKMLPARSNEGRLAATTSQMKESEAKQWLQEALELFSDVSQAYGKHGQDLLLFPHFPKTRS